MAEVLPLAAAAAFLAALPPGAGRSAGSALGRMAASPLRVRRSVVESQIAEAFPDRSAAWVRRTADACYRHFGRELAEVARLVRTGPSGLPTRMPGGADAVAAYRQMAGTGTGGVIVTGHLGNWEVAGAFLSAAGLRPAAVVKRQRNPRVDRLLRRARERLGVRSMTMEEAGREIPRVLRSGGAVALVADQEAGQRGIPVPFLGRPASTFRGPARVALGEGAPLFFGAVVREGGEYRAILEPIPQPAAERGAEAEAELTRSWVERLEREVRRRPEQYFWFHRRWKTGNILPSGTGERDTDTERSG